MRGAVFETLFHSVSEFTNVLYSCFYWNWNNGFSYGEAPHRQRASIACAQSNA